LHDLPKGCFVATYPGTIMTYADAQADGLKYGDHYLAELDFIQVRKCNIKTFLNNQDVFNFKLFFQVNEEQKEGFEHGTRNYIVEPDKNGESDEDTLEEEGLRTSKWVGVGGGGVVTTIRLIMEIQ